MFGDNLIVGEKTIKVDGKGRIIIPATTGIEKDEKLVLQVQKNFWTISSSKNIINELKSIKNNLKIGEYNEEYIAYCLTLLKEGTVDIQHRLIVSPIFNPGETIQAFGLGDALGLRKLNK